MAIGGVLKAVDTVEGIDGIVGIMVVFANKKKAKKWAGKREVMAFEAVSKEVKP